MEESHKLWKHHAEHQRELHQRNEHKDQQIYKNNPKFEIGQPLTVKNHAHHTFEPKYLLDYRVLKGLNNSRCLLTLLKGGKEKPMLMVYKPSSTTCIKAWDSILGSIKTKCRNYNYNPRSQPLFKTDNVLTFVPKYVFSGCSRSYHTDKYNQCVTP